MTLFDGNTVDYLIEHEEYKYYFDSAITIFNVSLNKNKGHLHLCQHATEVYNKLSGRCIKHRFSDVSMINTAIRRAGHIE